MRLTGRRGKAPTIFYKEGIHSDFMIPLQLPILAHRPDPLSQMCFIGGSFIHFLSASLVRVCHPFPVDLKAARTSDGL